VVNALASLPWVDADHIQIDSEKNVLIPIKDMKQYKEKDLIAALNQGNFSNVQVIKKGA
jgi:hypothetical protein